MFLEEQSLSISLSENDLGHSLVDEIYSITVEPVDERFTQDPQDVMPNTLGKILSKFASRRTIPEGTCFLDDGIAGECIWYIIEGTAKAEFISKDGREIWVEEYCEGDLAGASGLFELYKSGIRYVAETDLSVLVMPRPKFLQVLAAYPEVGLELGLELANRLNTITSRMIESAVLAAPARVCSELIRIARNKKPDGKAVCCIRVPTHAKLAARVQTSRETVSRTISELVKRGVLRVAGHKYVIDDLEALQDRAAF